MRRIHLLFVATAFFVLPTTGFADTPPEVTEAAALGSDVPEVTEAAPPDSVVPEDVPVAAPSEATDELAWDQFDDPDFDPEAATEDGERGSVQSLGSAEPDVAIEADAEIGQEVEPGIQLSEAAGPMTSSGVVLDAYTRFRPETLSGICPPPTWGRPGFGRRSGSTTTKSTTRI